MNLSKFYSVPALICALLPAAAFGAQDSLTIAKQIMKRFILFAFAVCAVFGQQMDTGSGAPTNSVGSNGDLYQRTDTGWIYGPKAAGAWPATYSVILGRGCTTAYHIDWYCTGYGVGGVDPASPAQTGGVDPNPLFGVDPGLTGSTPDGTVHTTAQVLAKYSTIDAFFAAVGYQPLRWWAISTTGNDSTCSPGTSAHALAAPCASFTPINFLAGDIVIMRAGSYTVSYLLSVSGTAANPIIITSYPGEKVTVDEGAGNGFVTLDDNYITFDGIEIYSSVGATGGNSGYCIDTGENTNNIFRNLWVHDCADDIITGNNFQNALLERNVMNNGAAGDGHDMYLGARQTANNNMVVEDNVIYAGVSTSFQWNGRCTSCLLTRNIIYQSGGPGFAIYNGVQNSTISNNLIINNNNGAVGMYVYDGGCTTVLVCPYPITNNTFVNNTVWQPSSQDQCAVWYVVDNNALGNAVGPNSWINNILLTSNGLSPMCFESGTVATDLSTTTFNNNVFKGGTDPIIVSGINGSPIGSYTCLTLSSVATVASCTNADPLLVNISNSLINTPWLIDPHLTGSSPANGTGTPTGAPTIDLQWKTRANPPSIGAYEASGPVGLLTFSACDLNQDGVVNSLDVQIAINQTLGISSCTNANLDGSGTCTVVDVQRVINAALGLSCRLGP
jgi:Right handed beta helix region